MNIHPICYSFRPHTPEERAALKNSVRTFGCKVPVMLWTDPKGKKWVIDGRHRCEVCAELEVTFPVALFQGTEDEAAALAQSMNEDRRQLSPQDRKDRLEKVARLRAEGKSLRLIAEAVKVSEKQVRNDLDKATAEGYAVEPKSGNITGKDGKSRPASPEYPPSNVGDAWEPPPEGLPVPPRHKTGKVVCDPAPMKQYLGKMARMIEEFGQAHGKGSRWLDCMAARDKLIQVWNAWVKEVR